MDDSQRMHSPDSDLLINSGGAPPPCEWRRSRGGQEFDLYADRWCLTSRDSINLAPLHAALRSDTLQKGAIRTLAHLAEESSYGHCADTLRQLRYLFEHAGHQIAGDEIPETAVVSYRHFCRARDGHDDTIQGRLRPFLTKWHALGYPGVSRELVERMANWTLTGSERGVAVNRLDINAGPMMPDEHQSFAVLALMAFEQERVTRSDYTVYRVLDVTGRRPEQMVQLKIKDMDDSKPEDNEPGQPPRRILLLHVPRIKGKRKWRQHYRAVPLSTDLWNLIITHGQDVKARFDALLIKLSLELQPLDLGSIHRELPLFPGWKSIARSLDSLSKLLEDGRHGDVVTQLRHMAESSTWHADDKDAVWTPLRRIIAKVGALNREGKPLHLFPYRFRYTMEYELERMGCQPSVIAWQLDHSSLESLVSYRKKGPDHAARLSKATARRMTKYARMFQGKVVDTEADAEGGDDPENSRLFIHEAKEGATCAVKRGCGMTAIPRCCYAGCMHFRPWIDGPHEQFLEELLEERERDRQALRPVEGRPIVEANDHVILGIVQVISLCENRREELARASTSRTTKQSCKGDKR